MKGLIYNQNHIPANEYRYGFRPSADVGCGWVATHNALHLMGYKTDLHQLIRYYEWQLPLIHGNAGTSFWGPAACFRHWGFQTELVADRKKFDAMAKASDVCILFYRWHKKTKFGAHFVALHHQNGTFIGYNTYRNSTKPDVYGPSLDAFLKEKHYYGCILLCIRDKR
ncbi:MAG: hypothetical protein IKA47_06315 [Oscillospiraceae bacterium]|nr:hypothetical protein [Oscillospiraceae bacterium]